MTYYFVPDPDLTRVGRFLTDPNNTYDNVDGLALYYLVQTERYDRSVCTGPMGRDGVMPSTSQERSLIEKNAHRMYKIVRGICSLYGIPSEVFAQARKGLERYPMNELENLFDRVFGGTPA